ncbi:chromosomal replication initiator protein DnaA [Liquorilactobacillus satsumensis]|uniref:Chromosomal replication initiator protein DnaA n=1 Tax=Liquorilactobacillus satsumensis DSM 16230 = JCM 12392 TaxID=1423801 RepID=A0A0R1UUK2_9LACO|nr:chromosomal replication initiator protein DnaA [Liquorilactobacillus satsumensis]KRL96790.1 chromosomal replication initiation protein [Liquorilactobacillus satsumensis DSM 16230 = JCM 12392]MCC7666470.1 chromosomal replication initiator protein DnaA [Liquorilactobacillus satsumensis]MCP9312591.1 chromosomal replication initiator protein DnaA [Liquorilactobacillus satsumensis]MCP9328897.1 chromosomal replication initiator protein DnaA [Liquorilactobacillus satsumensis]MCP9356756.1 chromosom
MPDLETLWQYICDEFKNKLSTISYNTWLKAVKPVAFSGNTLVIEVPTALHKDYWKANLSNQAATMIETSIGQKITIIAKLPEEPNPLQKPRYATSQPTGQNAVDSRPTFMRETKLNDKYTFETFVIGKGNQMAHAAALVVAEEPGALYNPLFFFGGVGLGKTHLMHAIGHQMLTNRPDAKVKYVTSEAFANDFINSIQTKRQEEFRKEYRSVDLLLVDDIQFFADKEGTQEEFFHTFNALYDDKKQIVLSSDRLPNEIPKLQKRLVSRFKWGLSVDITPPDLETRIAILRNKANADHSAIPDDTLSYIAGQIDSNIRELEGALVRVQAYSSMTHMPITTSLAADALKNLKLNGKSNEISISVIQDKVAKYYHISISDLKGKKRVKSIVLPRQVAMYLARELTDASLPKIGHEFGGKDHTTVIHAHEKISAELDNNSELQREVGDLKGKLKK